MSGWILDVGFILKRGASDWFKCLGYFWACQLISCLKKGQSDFLQDVNQKRVCGEKRSMQADNLIGYSLECQLWKCDHFHPQIPHYRLLNEPSLAVT